MAFALAAVAAKWAYPKLHLLRALTSGWDGYWYTLIAQHGYPARIINENHGSRWAFFPAFPAALRATVSTTGLSYVQAELLLSFVLGLASAIAIWLAVRELFGSVVADRTVLLYVFFPASYVLSMAYTEGMFIAAAAGCLFALSRRYWITASLLAIVASLTRSFGVVLIACVVAAAAPAICRRRQLRPFIAVVLSPVGFVAWTAYSWSVVGTPLAFVRAERFWGGSHFVWFRTPFLALGQLFTGLDAWKNAQVVLAGAALIFLWVGLILLARARDKGVSIPPFWWVFTIGSGLAMLSPYEPVSVLRYSLAVVPLFAAYAWAMRPAWKGPVVALMALGQGTLGLIVLVGTMYPHTWSIWP
jgi:hypothetical protein